MVGDEQQPSPMNDTPDLSVVVPVYGCAGCLRRLHATARRGAGVALVRVRDRPRRRPQPGRRVGASCRSSRGRDPRVRIIRLSRNFGQHAAITAGLTRSRGRWTVVMDCDLEEPPEEIPRLYAKAQEGYDDRPRGAARTAGIRRLSPRRQPRLPLPVPGVVAHDRIRDAEHHLAQGRRRVPQPARARPRVPAHARLARLHPGDGRRSSTASAARARAPTTLRRLVKVRLRRHVLPHDGAPAADRAARLPRRGRRRRPRRLRGLRALREDSPPGYTSIVVLLLLLSGFIIISLGIVGLYVGRIFDQVKGRPLFIVEEDRAGARDEDADRAAVALSARGPRARAADPRRRGDATGGTAERRRMIAAVLERTRLPAGAGSSTPGAAAGATWSCSRGSARSPGLEPAERSAAVARARGRGRRRAGLARRAGCRSTTGSFDLVACLDVLEHVADDARRAARAAPRQRGGWPAARDRARLPLAVGRPRRAVAGHFRRYTRASLLSAPRDAGWRATRVTGFNATLLPASPSPGRRTVLRGAACGPRARTSAARRRG